MAKGKIFEYAVIYHPPKKEKDEDVKASKLIVDVARILAASEQEAVMLAARAIPAEYVDKLEYCEIVVRPF